jgi:anthranilate phosphoribosyltransferase
VGNPSSANKDGAIFLIALRMKRETMDENEGILAAILAESDRQQVEVDELVDLGDPYSGYNRVNITPAN